MPIIDFQCSSCGLKFEHFYHASEAGSIDDCPCDECGEKAVRYFEFRKPHSYHGMSEVAVVYKSVEDGHYYVPGSKDARAPDGFERVEIRSAADARRVEKEMNATEYSKWQQCQERKEIVEYQQMKELREEMLGRLNGSLPIERIDEKTGRVVARHYGMSAAGRDFARIAIDQANQRPRAKYKGEVYFEAFSMNSSNRAEHRDEANGWSRNKR